MSYQVIQSRKSRETGATIQVIDNRDGSFECGEDGWITFCDTHGNYCIHPSRAVAVSMASVPTEWCEDCQDDYSTQGKGNWDDFA